MAAAGRAANAVERTGDGCLALNTSWERFVATGRLPPTPSKIDMGMLLRRRLIMLQLYRILPCVRTKPIGLLVLGVGQDDQFMLLARNPELRVTCVDLPDIIKLRSPAEQGNAIYKAIDILKDIDAVVDLVSRNQVVVAEGLFIYLPAATIQKILAAVEASGAVLIFNIENNALKRFLPLMRTGYEELARGDLQVLAEMPVTTWTRMGGHGDGGDVEVRLCTWVSSSTVSHYRV